MADPADDVPAAWYPRVAWLPLKREHQVERPAPAAAGGKEKGARVVPAEEVAEPAEGTARAPGEEPPR